MDMAARLPARIALAQLVVLGTALVVAGLHQTSAMATAAAASYRPPSFVVTEPTPARAKAFSATVGARARPHARPTTHGPRPATRPKRAPAPRVTSRPATKPGTHPARHAVVPTDFKSALAAAVARIPTYRAGSARWIVSRAYDFWGTADWYHDVLYVSPDVPSRYLYDVAVHEWSHELSVLDYAGDVAAATKAMNVWFGGSGLVGPERAADCMAILQGATWTHYTTCANATWRLGATKLVRGDHL
jgi:hypothetical protein